jgi:hypothetical protein
MAIRPSAAPASPCGDGLMTAPRYAAEGEERPENSDVRHLALGCSGHAVTMPSAWVRYFVGLPSWASIFSSSCLTPPGHRPERAPRIPAAHADCARAR